MLNSCSMEVATAAQSAAAYITDACGTTREADGKQCLQLLPMTTRLIQTLQLKEQCAALEHTSNSESNTLFFPKAITLMGHNLEP